MQALISLGNGDMRRTLNIFQVICASRATLLQLNFTCLCRERKPARCRTYGSRWCGAGDVDVSGPDHRGGSVPVHRQPAAEGH